MSTFAEQVSSAIAAHGMWKTRLRQAIDTGSSEFSVEVVKHDNQCAFGKWLYGEGKPGFPSPAAYENVRKLHAAFHVEAAGVLQLALAGKKVEANAAMGLGAGFSKASSTLVGALKAL